MLRLPSPIPPARATTRHATPESSAPPAGSRFSTAKNSPLRRSVRVDAKKSKKDVQMSEAAWFLDQFKYQQRYKAQTNVFTMPTKELPGGDKLTAEGAFVGGLFGVLAIWGVSLIFKLLSVTWALVLASLKYGAIAGVLVFLGVLVS